MNAFFKGLLSLGEGFASLGEGMASFLDFSTPTYEERRAQANARLRRLGIATNEREDAEAIAGDWRTVGNDLRNSMFRNLPEATNLREQPKTQ